MSKTMKICIIGGVAGGASAAARLRRLCETCHIKVFEKGPFASFANCGLPYRVGQVITDDSKLIVASPQLFHDRFSIDVKTMHEVLSINREKKTLSVRDLVANRDFEEEYDQLVIAVGANPIRPPLPGIDHPNIFVLRTIPDMQRIQHRIAEAGVKNSLVIGGGFIGLEMADNLRRIGQKVTVLEKLPQLMAVVSPDIANKLKLHMEDHGVEVILNDGVTSFEKSESDPNSVIALTEQGRRIESQLVLLAIGAKPDATLAQACGLDLGVRGSVKVDDQMRTSDPDIFAVGDMIEVLDVVTQQRTTLPLAGPANRQGRLAADAMKHHCNPRFRGVQGTAICKVFDLAVACTGASELTLNRAGIKDYEVIDIHPGHHVSYFPGAQPMTLKMIYRKSDGKIYGVQGIGGDGVDRRIDVAAMAIQMGATAFDLAQSELCYAPQFGAAKDPINMLGFVAVNAIQQKSPLADWNLVPNTNEPDVPETAANRPLVIDVRKPHEFAAQHIPGSVNIPLEDIRQRLPDVLSAVQAHGEIAGDYKSVVSITCQAGQRAHYAIQILKHHGIDARNLSGGMNTYCMRQGVKSMN